MSHPFRSSKIGFLFALPWIYFLYSFSENNYTVQAPPGADVSCVFKDVSYGPYKENTMDIALPKNRSSKKTPLLIFIHGGAWCMGDKRFFRKELEIATDSGFAVASIDYRLASNERHIHHKEITSDIQSALTFLKKHAAAFHISSTRVGLIGHSAGGHLALFMAYAVNEDKHIKTVVSWSGPSNFVDPKMPNGNGGPDFLALYTGTPLKDRSDSLVWKLESPFYRAQTNSVPTLLIQGELDPLVPPAIAERMKKRLDELGVKNSFLLLPASTHIYFGPGLTKARRATYSWMKEML
jgi:acetyl esterase/lipase